MSGKSRGSRSEKDGPGDHGQKPDRGVSRSQKHERTKQESHQEDRRTPPGSGTGRSPWPVAWGRAGWEPVSRDGPAQVSSKGVCVRRSGEGWRSYQGPEGYRGEEGSAFPFLGGFCLGVFLRWKKEI